MRDTNGQIDTTDNAVKANVSNSLRAGPRGYNLLEDTSVRKKMIHFDHERAPERVSNVVFFQQCDPSSEDYRSCTPLATVPMVNSNHMVTGATLPWLVGYRMALSAKYSLDSP